MDTLRFHLNERLVEEREVSPTTTLLRYLRDRLGLCGTKEGCAEGDCGACTVAVMERAAGGAPTYRAINSCLMLLPMVQGKWIYTVEGIGHAARPHAAQVALAERMGSQCGYCTPGVVMSLFEAAHRAEPAEAWRVDEQMCGNLCRCTGYRPIREAARAVWGRSAGALAAGPAEPMSLTYEKGVQRYLNPGSLEELLRVLAHHPEARIVCGGTDLALEVTKRFAEPPFLVSVESVPELARIERTEGGWRIGAAATLTRVQEALGGEIPALEKMFRVFASRQIRNRASIGGNLCTASPIGDTAPVLLALGATVTLVSKDGVRTMPLEQFFVGYRKTALAPGEVLASIELPRPPPEARCTSFKVSKRRELDISAVSAGMFARVVDGRVVEIRLAYGGMAPTPARARKAEAALLGGRWTRAAVEAATARVDEDFSPISDHRASAWYRRTVAKNLLLGFFLETERGGPALNPRPTSTVQLTEVA